MLFFVIPFAYFIDLFMENLLKFDKEISKNTKLIILFSLPGIFLRCLNEILKNYLKIFSLIENLTNKLLIIALITIYTGHFIIVKLNLLKIGVGLIIFLNELAVLVTQIYIIVRDIDEEMRFSGLEITKDFKKNLKEVSKTLISVIPTCFIQNLPTVLIGISHNYHEVIALNILLNIEIIDSSLISGFSISPWKKINKNLAENNFENAYKVYRSYVKSYSLVSLVFFVLYFVIFRFLGKSELLRFEEVKEIFSSCSFLFVLRLSFSILYYLLDLAILALEKKKLISFISFVDGILVFTLYLIGVYFGYGCFGMVSVIVCVFGTEIMIFFRFLEKEQFKEYLEENNEYEYGSHILLE